MVKLIVDDYEQISMLEEMLVYSAISYDLELADSSYGMRPPFLVVDGVPLDFGRASKWIKEHSGR